MTNPSHEGTWILHDARERILPEHRDAEFGRRVLGALWHAIPRSNVLAPLPLSLAIQRFSHRGYIPGYSMLKGGYQDAGISD